MENNKQIDEGMTIWEHISDLRRRLLFSLIALLVTTLISFAFAEQMVDFLAKPVGGINSLSSIEVTENITVFMQISLLSGFIFALPVILYQILGFIMEGLLPREKFWIKLSIPLAFIFFLSGVVFAYYFILPTAIPYLINFMGIKTMVRPGNYFDFVLNLLFWVGISFELPLVIYILAKIGIVNARMLIKQWRIAIVLISIFAAFITPTVDPINMSIMMAPLFLLYMISIIFALVARPRKNEKDIEKD